MSETEKFFEVLIAGVRDRTIVDCDGLFAPDARTEKATEWKNLVKGGASEEALKKMIAEVVDTTIYYLLVSSDDELLLLGHRSDSGREIDTRSHIGSGELATAFLGKDGMLAKFAKQRLSAWGEY